MRNHVHGDTDLKLGMGINMVHSNSHANFFYHTSTHLGAMTLLTLTVTGTIQEIRCDLRSHYTPKSRFQPFEHQNGFFWY